MASLVHSSQVQITSPLPLPINTSPTAIQIDSAGRSDDQPVYVGFASPGISTTTTGWKIFQILYDSQGNASQILYSSGTANYDKTWTLRTTYTYQ